MPKFNQATEHSTVVRWLKKEGDSVAKGDILFEIETDKAVMEVQSFYEGTLLKITVAAGQTVPVQTPVGFIGKPGEVLPPVSPTPAPTQSLPALAPPTVPSPPTPRAMPTPGSGIAQRREEVLPSQIQALHSAEKGLDLPAQSGVAPPFRISPRAAALAKASGIDPIPIAGSGPQGRVVERDVRVYLKTAGYDQLRITPAAKNLAVQEGLDLLVLKTKIHTRPITVAAVRRIIAEKPRPLSPMRQVIARRLTQSVTSAPHFYVTVAADLTELLAFRQQLKTQGAPYTITDFVLQATAQALGDFPDVNSTTDGRQVQWHSQVHLGLAVALDPGLVVPVIRNAAELTLRELHDRAAELVAKARAGKLLLSELSGSTFTISNLGMLPVENFTAIINPGESAILAVSSALKKPVVKDDTVVIRSLMNLTLSADHRLIDGALAARFVNAIKLKLEEIELWKRLTSW